MSIDFIYNWVKKRESIKFGTKEYFISKLTWNPLVRVYKKDEYIYPSFSDEPICVQFSVDRHANKRTT